MDVYLFLFNNRDSFKAFYGYYQTKEKYISKEDRLYNLFLERD